MDYGRLLYKRGYLFSEAEIEPPVSSWRRQPVGDYHICFDPENPFAFRQEGARWVAFLGRAVDVLHWSMDVDAIVRECLDRLSYSEDKLLDYIDHLSGRFVIIYYHGGSTKLMTDAFGTRSAFYSLQSPVMIASHCKIIAGLRCARPSERMESVKKDRMWVVPKARVYPGILTPHEGIYILTPNTLINTGERRIERFYPRRELPVGDLSEVVDEVSVMLKRQLELLRSRHNLVISLSGGIDTRTTLAAARDISQDLLFFTYGDADYLDSKHVDPSQVDDAEAARATVGLHEYARRTLGRDMLLASDIAQALDLPHVRLEDATANEEGFQEFNRVLDCSTHHRHARRLAKAYLEHLPSNALHIRSNLSGVGKAIYRRQGFGELPLTAETMAKAWKRMGHNQGVVAAFDDFVRVSEFGRILNYDPYDMFHWEHGEGTWMTFILLESDVAFDTFEVFGCRAVMEKVLSVPVEQRLTSGLHREIINRLWPALLQWPINEPPFRLQLENLRADYARLKESADGLRGERDNLRKERDRLKGRLQATAASFSYRLGSLLVQAVSRPGRNTVLLPYRLMRLCVSQFKKRKATSAGRPTSTLP